MNVRVDWRSSCSFTGSVLKWLAVPLGAPLAIAIFDARDLWPFAATVVVTVVIGVALERLATDRSLGQREAFLMVALTWLGVSLIGAIPLVLAGDGSLAHPINAAFESTSGITTTGATVIEDFDDHSRAVMFWRQLLQWLGGLGILIVAIGLLSSLRVGGAQLMETETQTRDVQKLTPSIAETARLIWGLYIGLTALAAATLFALHLLGLAPNMDLFNAVSHALTSVATAGFSPEAESVGAFEPIVQWTLIPFMFLGATNFVLLYYLTQGRYRRPLESEEFRFYVAVVAVLGAMVVVLLALEGGAIDEGTIRHALFNVVSMLTTTGYASMDFNAWTPGAKHVLFLCMFLGGMAGSTTCSIKLVRWLVILKAFKRLFFTSIHPEAIRPVRLSDEVVDEDAVHDIFSYVLLAIVIFFLLTMFVVSDAARVDTTVDEFEALGAAASIFFNIGPAFGLAGPMDNYAGFPVTTRAVMVVMMWVGRIEIVPVLVLLTPAYWRS